MDEFYPSSLVESIAGRDKDRYFIVLAVEDEQYVAISDGKMRKTDHPKRKKKKHLKTLGRSSELIAQKLRDGQRITNNELKTAIAELTAQQGE